MSLPRGSLERHQPRARAEPDDLQRMAAAAWHQRGLALIDPEKISNEWERQAVVTIANRLYGKRRDDGQ